VDWTQVLEARGLAAKRDSAFASLSGGQRQRLLLALVTDPEVVFLDEMTTGLDPAARHTTWELIEAIRERGTTVVLVTHFMDEAERLCDRIAIMDAGRIVAMGTPAALIEANAGEVRVKFSAGAMAARTPVQERSPAPPPTSTGSPVSRTCARFSGADPLWRSSATDRCSRTSPERCSRTVSSRRTCASNAPRSKTPSSS
jgi:ABC-type multidrug transport system ATPase subunit